MTGEGEGERIEEECDVIRIESITEAGAGGGGGGGAYATGTARREDRREGAGRSVWLSMF